MTVKNVCNGLNVTDSGDGNINNNRSLDNEFSDFRKAFDSSVYTLYVYDNELQGVVPTDGFYTEESFYGENMINFVDNQGHELCTKI